MPGIRASCLSVDSLPGPGSLAASGPGSSVQPQALAPLRTRIRRGRRWWRNFSTARPSAAGPTTSTWYAGGAAPPPTTLGSRWTWNSSPPSRSRSRSTRRPPHGALLGPYYGRPGQAAGRAAASSLGGSPWGPAYPPGPPAQPASESPTCVTA